jgi:hypothetical protein
MHQMRISTNKVSSVMLRPKKFEIRTNWENCERAEKQKTTSAMKLSQMHRMIELHVCMREIIIRFEMNL